MKDVIVVSRFREIVPLSLVPIAGWFVTLEFAHLEDYVLFWSIWWLINLVATQLNCLTDRDLDMISGYPQKREFAAAVTRLNHTLPLIILCETFIAMMFLLLMIVRNIASAVLLLFSLVLLVLYSYDFTKKETEQRIASRWKTKYSRHFISIFFGLYFLPLVGALSLSSNFLTKLGLYLGFAAAFSVISLSAFILDSFSDFSDNHRLGIDTLAHKIGTHITTILIVMVGVSYIILIYMLALALNLVLPQIVLSALLIGIALAPLLYITLHTGGFLTLQGKENFVRTQWLNIDRIYIYYRVSIILVALLKLVPFT